MDNYTEKCAAVGRALGRLPAGELAMWRENWKFYASEHMSDILKLKEQRSGLSEEYYTKLMGESEAALKAYRELDAAVEEMLKTPSES